MSQPISCNAYGLMWLCPAELGHAARQRRDQRVLDMASTSLRACAGRLSNSMPANPASFSRICNPVVPASPSMKILMVMSVSQPPSNRTCGPRGPHGNMGSASAVLESDHGMAMRQSRDGVKRLLASPMPARHHAVQGVNLASARGVKMTRTTSHCALEMRRALMRPRISSEAPAA